MKAFTECIGKELRAYLATTITVLTEIDFHMHNRDNCISLCARFSNFSSVKLKGKVTMILQELLKRTIILTIVNLVRCIIHLTS